MGEKVKPGSTLQPSAGKRQPDTVTVTRSSVPAPVATARTAGLAAGSRIATCCTVRPVSSAARAQTPPEVSGEPVTTMQRASNCLAASDGVPTAR